MKNTIKKTLPILLLLVLTAGWKLIFLLRDVVPFNSDEAIVALMARHILQGERPVFFYGQAYMGALDAWLVAGGFFIFGQQIWVIRLVQTVLYLGTVGTTYCLGQTAFCSRKIGFLAAMLLAIPAVNTTLYTTASLGGYGEALLIGNVILLVSLAIQRQARGFLFALWGILAGIGLWANGLTLVYAAPSGLFLLWVLFQKHSDLAKRDRWLAFVWITAGMLVGAAPWWLYALRQGPQNVIAELFGNAVAVEQTPWLVQVGQHLLSYLLFGLTALFGFRPPWEVRWLALPLLPFILAFWLAVIVSITRGTARAESGRAVRWLLIGVILALTAGFLFTPFGVDPSGRYFLPLAIPLALFAAEFVQKITPRWGWQAAIIAIVVFYQGWGTFQASNYPPGLTTQFYTPSVVDHRYDEELIHFLEQEGETRGYTNYWVAYPLAFRSQERLIFVPALPYHPDLRYTARDDRYAPYRLEVEQSARVAYIVTHNPRLTAALRSGLRQAGVTWQEHRIGDFEIFYRLSSVVSPLELNLGLNP